jgi:hypothetical protein
MLNRDVFCRVTMISVKIFAPYNAFQRNNSKELFDLEIFLSPNVPVWDSSMLHSPGRIVPNFLKL